MTARATTTSVKVNPPCQAAETRHVDRERLLARWPTRQAVAARPRTLSNALGLLGQVRAIFIGLNRPNFISGLLVFIIRLKPRNDSQFFAGLNAAWRA